MCKSVFNKSIVLERKCSLCRSVSHGNATSIPKTSFIFDPSSGDQSLWGGEWRQAIFGPPSLSFQRQSTLLMESKACIAEPSASCSLFSVRSTRNREREKMHERRPGPVPSHWNIRQRKTPQLSTFLSLFSRIVLQHNDEIKLEALCSLLCLSVPFLFFLSVFLSLFCREATAPRPCNAEAEETILIFRSPTQSPAKPNKKSPPPPFQF